MKKLVLLFTISVLAPTSSAFARTLDCLDDFNKDVKVDTKFDSSAPSLESVTTTYNPDGSVISEKKQIFFSPTEVCSMPMNFAESCSFREQMNKSGYEFHFECTKANLSGYFFADGRGGFGHFACNGEVPYLFFGCKKP